MTPEGARFLRIGEYGLTEALAPLAQITRAIGARSVSVMVFEDGGFLRVVYQWPEASAGSASLFLERNALASQECWEELIGADSIAGRFLARTTNSPGPFYLIPWPARPWKTIIAFGISTCESRSAIAEEFAPAIQLAALAAWSAVEVHRLRDELRIVNERLGRRKLVERAKGLLQARGGGTEQEAYEQLRKLSRQRRTTLADTAQDLLRSSRESTG